MERPDRRRGLWLLALGLALALGGKPAGAYNFSAVAITINPANTANFFDDVGAVGSVAQRTASVLSSTATTFSTRYAAVVGADTGGAGGASFTQNFVANFTVSFQVNALPNEWWGVILDVSRIGAMTLIDDGSGNATVTMGAMTGTRGGAGALTSGSLNLAALADTTNAGAQTTSPNNPFNQTTNAWITGRGTGGAQLVTLTFAFTASATTTDPPGGGTPQGDEAALRMGMNSALSSFTADNYPGVGGRTLANDGIFVNATLIPEPETALMLSFGLGGLAVLGRDRRLRETG
jgi:hypothetical protein